MGRAIPAKRTRVIPVKAGIHFFGLKGKWIPDQVRDDDLCGAGMTIFRDCNGG